MIGAGLSDEDDEDDEDDNVDDKEKNFKQLNIEENDDVSLDDFDTKENNDQLHSDRSFKNSFQKEPNLYLQVYIFNFNLTKFLKI